MPLRLRPVTPSSRSLSSPVVISSSSSLYSSSFSSSCSSTGACIGEYKVAQGDQKRIYINLEAPDKYGSGERGVSRDVTESRDGRGYNKIDVR